VLCLFAAAWLPLHAAPVPQTFGELDFAMTFVEPKMQVSMDAQGYGDPDKDPSAYKTFALERTSRDNPLLEKELLKTLEEKLLAAGLTRSEEKPDILVVMHSFVGKKAQFTLPGTLTTMRIPYQWALGPARAAGGTASSADDTYYRHVRLYFLDYAELAQGAKLDLPPLLWMGEVGSSGTMNDIRVVAPFLFRGLLEEFPKSSGKSTNRMVSEYVYGVLGVRFDAGDWRIIREVLPGGPAAAAGLHADDTIVRINGINTLSEIKVSWSGDVLENHRKKDPYYQNVLTNLGTSAIELEVSCPHTKSKPKVKLTPMAVSTQVIKFGN